MLLSDLQKILKEDANSALKETIEEMYTAFLSENEDEIDYAAKLFATFMAKMNIEAAKVEEEDPKTYGVNMETVEVYLNHVRFKESVVKWLKEIQPINASR